MTTPGKNVRSIRRQPRRTVQTILSVAVLGALLVPSGYLFTKLWSSTSDGIRTVGTERGGLAYARPLSKLLGTLLDAQAQAVVGGNVDDTPIRGAVDEVNAADRQAGDPLGVRQRWGQLSHEIDTVLGQKPTGSDAIPGYGTPIGLAQALLGRISDDVKVSPDFGPSGYHLVETALEDLPEVSVNAGQLTALAHVVDPSRKNAPPDNRLTVAQDRAAQAASAVSVGLRAGGDPTSTFPVDLNMLGPLDEFAAAVDALTQTSAALAVPNSGARNQIDAVDERVQKAALTLEAAVLTAFDSQLTSRAGGYDTQRRDLLVAGVVIALAAAVLLWLRVPTQGVAGSEPVEEVAPETPSSMYAPVVERPVPAPAPIPDLVDARELLTPELVHVGRAVRARKRRETDDPR
jgi:hypothetical protein